MTEPVLTPWTLLTATGALMAFHVGLYTLVGRERKSPYVINTVFWLFFLCLIAASVEICAALLSGPWQDRILFVAGVLLLSVTLLTADHNPFRVLYR